MMEKNEVVIGLKQQNLALAVLIDHCQSCDIYKRESTLIIAILFSAPFPFCLVQWLFFFKHCFLLCTLLSSTKC